LKEVLDILFISSWFPNRNQPKLGNFVERHAQAIALNNRVHAVHVVPDKWSNEFVFTSDKERSYTTTHLYHPAWRLHRWFRPYFLRKAVLEAMRVHKFNPDLIHLNVFHPFGTAAAELSQALGIPMIATEHWTGYHANTHNTISLRIKNQIIQAAQQTRVICPVTHQLASAMRAFGIEGQYEVIPNVVDTQLFHPAGRQKTKKEFTFLHVSSLFDVHKNVSGLLRTTARMVHMGASFKLKIVGDGDATPHVKYARELGLTDANLEFIGAQPLTSIAQHMRDADAFVLFSNYENLPCVIGESLASGVPVISTRVGGISEHLNRQNGILIEAGNEVELETAMYTLLRGGQLFEPDQLRNYAVTNFSESAIAMAYDQVYRKALELNRRD
jgi:glycosyltransferase involved in cell wall biosynthesis